MRPRRVTTRAGVVRAIRAGASGFLGKGVEPAELLDAIRIVAGGDALLSPRARRGLLAQLAYDAVSLPVTDPTSSSSSRPANGNS